MDEDPTGLKAEGGKGSDDRQQSLGLKIKVPKNAVMIDGVCHFRVCAHRL